MTAEFWFSLILRAMAGVVLGLVYFSSLWWIARRLPRMSRPALWIPLSTLSRMLLLLGAVYVLMEHRWEWLIAVMAGYLMGRYLVFWQTGVFRPRSGFK